MTRAWYGGMPITGLLWSAANGSRKHRSPPCLNRHPTPYTRKLIDAEPPGHPVAAETGGPELIKVDKLNVHFPIKKDLFGRVKDRYHALRDVAVKVRPGQTPAAVGESGRR